MGNGDYGLRLEFPCFLNQRRHGPRYAAPFVQRYEMREKTGLARAIDNAVEPSNIRLQISQPLLRRLHQLKEFKIIALNKMPVELNWPAISRSHVQRADEQ